MTARAMIPAGFAVTLACGLAVLTGGGAPGGWLAVQGSAALVALLLLAPPVRRAMARAAPLLVLAAPLALLATLLADPGMEGVHRWVGAGPLNLHMGLLLVPALLLLHARGDQRWTGLSLIGCAAMIGLQPDRGMALGLLLGLMPIAVMRRTQADIWSLLAAIVTLACTMVRADPLQPVALVEGVLTQSWAMTPWTGPVALIGALALPLGVALASRRERALLVPVLAANGLWLGLLLASLIGHYPVPLLGYGASAVIGWALALAWMEAPTLDAKQRV